MAAKKKDPEPSGCIATTLFEPRVYAARRKLPRSTLATMNEISQFPDKVVGGIIRNNIQNMDAAQIHALVNTFIKGVDDETIGKMLKSGISANLLRQARL